MSIFSKFEDKVEGAVDSAAGAVFASPIEPAQIAKRAEKQMKREKLVGSGKQYAPTLYNVLVNPRDDKRLFGFYPTMATEIENHLYARGTEAGLEFDIRPLVRFIADAGLKKGKFDVIAEVVSAPIITKLREEELEYYGIKSGAVGAKGAAGRRQTHAEPDDASSGGFDDSDSSGGFDDSTDSSSADSGAHDRLGRSMNSDGLDVWADLTDIDAGEYAGGGGGKSAAGSLSLPPLLAEKEESNVEPGVDERAAQRTGNKAEADGPLAGSPHTDGPLAGSPLADGPLAGSPLAGRRAAQRIGNEAKADGPDTKSIGTASVYVVSEHRRLPLRRRMMTIGRGMDNDIVLADANASRIHARLSQDATGRWKISDLGSTNGILLNGRPADSAILKDGDEITVGMTILEFSQ
ncbi:MAG: FHA domain-containing protein [Coriobacteriales bacterium]|nr:FHA domain-containing protein [Coriobacteriales bacterium]